MKDLKVRWRELERAECMLPKHGWMVRADDGEKYVYVCRTRSAEDNDNADDMLIPFGITPDEDAAVVFRDKYIARSMRRFWNVMRKSIPGRISIFEIVDIERMHRSRTNLNALMHAIMIAGGDEQSEC